MLTQTELIRYDRQIRLPIIGKRGQDKLKHAHVTVVGIGGLGCTSAFFLAAAGVGQLTLVDCGIVELSNLNRQILYQTNDIGKKKVAIAAKRLRNFNPKILIRPIDEQICEKTVSDIIDGTEIVIDGLDNMASRLILNAECVKRRIPYIYGGVSRIRGMVTTFIPGKTPCLSCVYGVGTGGIGVLGSAASLIANIQTIEAMKIILGLKPALAGRLLMFNGDEMKFKYLDICRNVDCGICHKLSGTKD